MFSADIPPFWFRRKLPSGVWKVHAVKDLRVVNGRREWLIGWAGADGKDAWPDSWEPSNLLSRDLIDDFLLDRKERLLRVVSVDARPPMRLGPPELCGGALGGYSNERTRHDQTQQQR